MSDSELIQNLTDEMFMNEVLREPGMVVLDFYADWCAPCKAMMPAFQKAAENYQGKMKFYKIDADDQERCSNLVSQYGVRSIPTLFVLNIKSLNQNPDGQTANVDVEVIEKLVGSLTEDVLMEKMEESYNKVQSSNKTV